MTMLGSFLGAFLDQCSSRTGLAVRVLAGRSFASYEAEFDLELEVEAGSVECGFAKVQTLLSKRFSASLAVMWQDEDISGADIANCIFDLLDLWKKRRPSDCTEPSEVVQAFLQGLLVGDVKEEDVDALGGSDQAAEESAESIWGQIAARILLDSKMNAAFRAAVDAHPEEPDFDAELAGVLTEEVLKAKGKVNAGILSRAISLAEDQLRSSASERGVVTTTRRGMA